MLLLKIRNLFDSLVYFSYNNFLRYLITQIERIKETMKKLLLLATGGTIASVQTEHGLAPDTTAEEILTYIPEAKKLCDLNVRQILNIDSTNIQPEHWIKIATEIQKEYEHYDGFVITHGTDTMAYTSAALSYLIQNSEKPIIITGSQRPISAPITDATKNLMDSIRFATKNGVKGVYILYLMEKQSLEHGLEKFAPKVIVLLKVLIIQLPPLLTKIEFSNMWKQKMNLMLPFFMINWIQKYSF